MCVVISLKPIVMVYSFIFFTCYLLLIKLDVLKIHLLKSQSFSTTDNDYGKKQVFKEMV